MKALYNLAVAAILIMTVACSGGDGRHHEAAQIFVNNLNDRDPGGNYFLVKDETISGGNRVILVNGRGRTYAINIDDHHRDDHRYDIDYFNGHRLRVFEDGFVGGETVFADSRGYLYSATRMNPKNKRQAKLMAAIDEFRVGEVAKSFQKDFGFSKERALELGDMYVATANKLRDGTLTDEYVDSLGMPLIGTKFSEAQKAFASGNEAKQEAILETAGKLNDGRSAAQAKAFMTKIFMDNGVGGML